MFYVYICIDLRNILGFTLKMIYLLFISTTLKNICTQYTYRLYITRQSRHVIHTTV